MLFSFSIGQAQIGQSKIMVSEIIQKQIDTLQLSGEKRY
tara:strand:+ start:17986 stop:18102 length:117 start_codon:yes stop_codon:yes gene_type:complete